MSEYKVSVKSINRIRLEFKVFSAFSPFPFTMVLIESDWNLKFNARFSKYLPDGY